MTLTGPDLLPEESPDWAEEFAAICDSTRGRLVRWLTAIFGPRDAEDIAQEALARLYVRPGLLEEDADPWPWLSVVARNVGRDMMRHAAYSTTVESGTLDLLPHETRVHEQVVARDDAERLRLALNAISPRDRMLIELRDVRGIPVGDIAELLGMNDNAVRQLLFRARKRLANTYLDLGGDRHLGLFGTLGLRCREWARKHVRELDAIAPTVTSALAAVAPVIAGILGGSLFLGTTPAAAPVRQVATSLDTSATGLDGRGPGTPIAVRGLLGQVLPTSSPTPFISYGTGYGGAGVRARIRNPFDNSAGESDRIEVYVSNVPVLGHVGVSTWEYSYGKGLQGRACERLNCPQAVPTPMPIPGGR